MGCNSSVTKQTQAKLLNEAKSQIKTHKRTASKSSDFNDAVAKDSNSIIPSTINQSATEENKNSLNRALQDSITKSFYQLKANGCKYKEFMWKLMTELDDEKAGTHEINAVSLLVDIHTDKMCPKGHTISQDRPAEHFCGKPCVQCGHSNRTNETLPTDEEVIVFLNAYEVADNFPRNSNEGAGWWFRQNNLAERYPLHYAATEGDVITIKKICAKTNKYTNQTMNEWKHWTPLHWAAGAYNLEAVIELIKGGADPFPAPGAHNTTPYTLYYEQPHKAAITKFFRDFATFKYGVNLEQEAFECVVCYQYENTYHPEIVDPSRAKYVHCSQCLQNNVNLVKEKMKTNKFMSGQILQILRANPHLSVDTLCGMRDKKALESTIKEILITGNQEHWNLYLFDLDYFKKINSALTHHGADIKLKQVGKVLKQYEKKTTLDPDYWTKQSISVDKILVFRQGGDEFAMIVHRPLMVHNKFQKYKGMETQQKLYEMIRDELNQIKIEKECDDGKGNKIKSLTFSVGVYVGHLGTYDEWLINADKACEKVKDNGRNGMRILMGENGRISTHFTT